MNCCVVALPPISRVRVFLFSRREQYMKSNKAGKHVVIKVNMRIRHPSCLKKKKRRKVGYSPLRNHIIHSLGYPVGLLIKTDMP